MARWVAVLAVVISTSCGSVPAANRSTSTPSSAPTATSARVASPSPVAAASPTPAFPEGLACRLPVVTDQLQGAFITFPNPTAIADPAGSFVFDQSTSTYKSNATPVLRGSDQNRELFYDRAAKRWLPSSRAAVRTDGASYAYVSRSATSFKNYLHIVDIGSGRESVFEIAHPTGYAAVYEYAQGGVYVEGSTEASEAGLWLVNPLSGAERAVASTGGTVDLAISGGGAWLAYTQNPNSYTGGWDTVDRLDLTTGRRTLWFHRDGAAQVGVGFASDGTPIMYPSFSNGTSEAWLTKSPSVRQRIFTIAETFTSVGSDSQGIWFFSAHGIYLDSATKRIRLVSAVVAGPAGSCA